MKKTLGCWCVIFAVTVALIPQVSIASHQITFFKNNKKGAVSITFDDGYPSQVTNALPLLNARNLKGTFFIVTSPAWIDSHVPWEAWRSAAGQGHEIGSTTVHHPDLTTLAETEMRWELSESLRVIRENIPLQSSVPFAYPYGNSNGEVQRGVEEYYPWAKGAWATEGGFLNSYGPGAGREAVNFLYVGSYDVGPETTLPDLDRYLDLAENENAWFCVHFYEVVDVDFFSQFLNHLLERDLWAETFGAIARYMRERQSAELTVVSESASEIRLRLAHSLDPSVYGAPLTLRSVIPSHWKEVVVEQGDAITLLTPVNENKEVVVYYDALPNGEEILLWDSAQGRKFLYVANNPTNRVDRNEHIAMIEISSGATIFLRPTYDEVSNPGGWANPEGITFVGKRLFVAAPIFGTEGQGGIWEIDPVTGTEIRSFPADLGKPTGLASDGTDLYVTQSISKKSRILKFTPSGQRIRSFELEVDLQGLAYGRGYLFGVNKNKLYTIHPSTGAIVASQTLPIRHVIGLDFIDVLNPFLLASVKSSDKVYRLELSLNLDVDGTVETFCFVPQGYNNSVALTIRQ